MAIVVEEIHTDSTTSTPFTFTMNGAAPSGRLLVACIARDDDTPAWNIPTGWVEVGQANANDCNLWYGYKLTGASEPTSYEWSGDAESYAGVIYEISGHDATTPIDANTTIQSGQNTAANTLSLSYSTNALVISGVVADRNRARTLDSFLDGSDNQDVGSGDGAIHIGISVGYKLQTTSGSTGVLNHTLAATDGYHAFNFSIAEAAASGTTVSTTPQSLNFSTSQATIQQHTNVSTTPQSLNFSTSQATIATTSNISTTPQSLNFSTSQATIATTSNISTTPQSLNFSTSQATVLAATTIATTPQSLNFSTSQATIQTGADISTTPQSLNFSTSQATIATTSNISTTPQSLNFSTSQATIATTSNISTTPQSLNFSTSQATIQTGADISTTPQSLNFSTSQATIQTEAVTEVVTTPQSLSFSTSQATIDTTTIVITRGARINPDGWDFQDAAEWATTGTWTVDDVAGTATKGAGGGDGFLTITNWQDILPNTQYAIRVKVASNDTGNALFVYLGGTQIGFISQDADFTTEFVFKGTTGASPTANTGAYALLDSNDTIVVDYLIVEQTAIGLLTQTSAATVVEGAVATEIPTTPQSLNFSTSQATIQQHTNIITHGLQLVGDSEFDDFSAWTTGTGWSVVGGVASAINASSNLTYTSAIPEIKAGDEYRADFLFSNYGSGVLRLIVGDTVSGFYPTVGADTNPHSVLITATNDDTGDATGLGSISLVGNVDYYRVYQVSARLGWSTANAAIQVGVNISTTPQSLNFSTSQATIQTGADISTTPQSLNFSTSQAAVLAAATIATTPQSLNFSTSQATIQTGADISTTPQSLNFSTSQATIATTSNISTTPQSLNFSTSQATIAATSNISTTPQSLNFSTSQATIQTGADISTTPQSLNFSTSQATIENIVAEEISTIPQSLQLTPANAVIVVTSTGDQEIATTPPRLQLVAYNGVLIVGRDEICLNDNAVRVPAGNYAVNVPVDGYAVNVPADGYAVNIAADNYEVKVS